MIPTFAICTTCAGVPMEGQRSGRFLLTDRTFERWDFGVWLDIDDAGVFWAVCAWGATEAGLTFTHHHDQQRAKAMQREVDRD